MENKKQILIILEGHDDTGKDSLLDMIKNDFKDIYIYKQLSHEETKTNCKDKKSYEQWLIDHHNEIYDDLCKISDEYKIIIMSRFYITDNVFSDLFNRSHIVENNFREKFEKLYDVKNFIILWDDYNEYYKRMKRINQPLEYNEKDFNKIKELFIKYNDNDTICYIKDLTTREELKSKFLKFISNFYENC